MSIGITIKGMDRLERGLGKLQASRYMMGILKAAASEVKGYIAVYPEASSANQPKGPGEGAWYERGYGSRWVRKDGTANSAQTSETLGRRWTISSGRDVVIVGNNASYAPYVQSAEQQAPFHKARGWRTDEETLEKLQPSIIEKARKEIERILSEI